MGGNLFKEQSIRLPKQDFLAVEQRWLTLLQQLGLTAINIEFVREKSDFGDLDILVESTPNTFSMIQNYCEQHNLPYIKNGNIFSLLENNFQIDLIFIPQHQLAYAKSYFSYNDLGNLIGRMAKKLGFKHGFQGLYFVYKQGDRVIDEILLSLQPEKIYEILQLDSRISLQQGFDTFNDLFEFVVSSPYFSPSIYLFENINHTSRMRDRKRKTYNEFLKYCENLSNTTIHYPADKSLLAIQYFPWLKEKLLELDEKVKLGQQIKQKFNGDIVSQLTGLTDKSLGQFMAYLKTLPFYQHLPELSATEINSTVLKEFSQYQQNYISINLN